MPRPRTPDRPGPALRRLLAELDAALAELEPVPARAIAAAQACYTWFDVDAELAELLFDSADGGAALVRSDGERRLLVFGSAERAVQFETVDRGGGFDLVGFITPGRPAEVRAQRRGDDGPVGGDHEPAVRADESGAFTLAAVAPGMVRLVIGAPGAGPPLVTPWFVLGS